MSAYRARCALLIQHIGTTPLAQLTTQDVQRMWAVLLRADYTPGTLKLMRIVLIMALDVAEEWDLVGKNVARKTRIPRVPQSGGTPLTIDQTRALLAAAERHDIGSIVAMGVYLGLRRGEIMALQWQDVDLERGTLHVRHTLPRGYVIGELPPPKTASSVATIPLPTTIIALLRAQRAQIVRMRWEVGTHWQDHDQVYPTWRGTPFHGDDVWKRFARARAEVGLGHIRFHDLRHTTATMLGALRDAHGTPIVPPKVMQRILRHGKIETTFTVYTHVTDSTQTSAAMNALDASLGMEDERKRG